MKEAGQERNPLDRWYHATDDGMPDFSRPITDPEMVQLYRDLADQHPHTLADLYVNFHQFDQVEFLVFKDRLSAAILVSNSTQHSVDEVRAGFAQQKKDGSHRVKGWEGETDDILDDDIYVADNALAISIGASMLTAAAALEGLLKDLVPEGGKSHGGLTQLVKDFLRRNDVEQKDREEILAMVGKVSERRNAFAHTLIGSYWAKEEPGFKFDRPTLDDTLFTVGEIALALEDVMLE